MEQYTRGIWKMLKRMKKLLKQFRYYGIFFFIHFIFGRKDGRKGNYIYNTDLSDSMFLLSNLCYVRELNLLTQVMEGFEGYKAERHSDEESDLKKSAEKPYSSQMELYHSRKKTDTQETGECGRSGSYV